MDIKIFAAAFVSIFLAELGDKTQMATLLLASDREVNKVELFVAASSALVLATFMGSRVRDNTPLSGTGLTRSERKLPVEFIYTELSQVILFQAKR